MTQKIFAINLRPAIQILMVAFLAISSTALTFCFKSYRRFHRSLVFSNGIRTGNQQAEVLYRLGSPTHVLGPVEKSGYGEFQRFYSVGGATRDQNGMPSDKKIEDYNEWVYGKPNTEDRFIVGFDTYSVVESFTLFSGSTDPRAWGPVAGIRNGDSEEKILGLGEPSEIEIQGTTKIITFSDMGLKFCLTKGRVYTATVKYNGKIKYADLSHYLHSIISL